MYKSKYNLFFFRRNQNIDDIAAPREEGPVEIFENDVWPQIPDHERDGEGASSSGDSGFEMDSGDDMSEAEEEGFRKCEKCWRPF